MFDSYIMIMYTAHDKLSIGFIISKIIIIELNYDYASMSCVIDHAFYVCKVKKIPKIQK